MKTIKYFLVAALLLGVATATKAQDSESKATIESVKKLVKDNPADLDDQIKAIYKKNKKNADVLVGIGRAYYEVEDTAHAKEYANYALKANKSSAPAFILLGDIEALGSDGGSAAMQYQQAIYFDPKNPEPYVKYASVYRKVSPSEAVAKLDELRAQRPDIAVDALAGHIYYSSNEFDKAATSFAKVDKAKLEERDLTEYAMALYFQAKYAESLEIAKYGLSKLPRDAAYNRLAFFNNTDLGNFPVALQYADALFNKSDSAKLSYFDYTYYGNALIGNKQFEEAIAAFNTALGMEFDNQDKKAGVIKQLSEGYKAMSDYPKAIDAYRDYMKTISKVSGTDYVGLGQLYLYWAGEDTIVESQQQHLRDAEIVYNEMEEKMPEFEEYTVYKKAQVNAMLDPETTEGLAKPYYEKLAGMLEPKETKDGTDKVRLIESYRYLGYYYLVKDDKENSDLYWNKVLELDPDNLHAKQVLGLVEVE